MKYRHAFLADFFSAAAKAAFAVLCLATASTITINLLQNDPSDAYLFRASMALAGGFAVTFVFFCCAYVCAALQDFDALNDELKSIRL